MALVMPVPWQIASVEAAQRVSLMMEELAPGSQAGLPGSPRISATVPSRVSFDDGTHWTPALSARWA